MSFLPSNFRLLTRFTPLVRTSRANAQTTTANATKQVPIPTRTNPKYFRIAALVVFGVGFLALFRASRKEEQMIAHSVDAKFQTKPEPHQK